MSSKPAAILALLLAAGLGWGMLRLLGTQYATGTFYPEYSSLRAAPQGTKLLFDSLNRLHRFKATRNYLPLDFFPERAADVLVLGLHPERLDPPFLQRLEKVARAGNRVVAALVFDREHPIKGRTALENVWHVRLVVDPDSKQAHPLSLSAGRPWMARSTSRAKTLALERPFGSGSVLLLAESDVFSNETLIAGRVADTLDAIGPRSAVVFDEQHLGISESGSVVGLLMRFRLAGLALGLMLLAGLALWKYTAAFPPPAAVTDAGYHAGRTSFEGLLALLRRHVSKKDLAQACWEEWLKANRRQVAPESAQKASAIVESGGSDPLQAVRALQIALRAKGEH